MRSARFGRRIDAPRPLPRFEAGCDGHRLSADSLLPRRRSEVRIDGGQWVLLRKPIPAGPNLADSTCGSALTTGATAAAMIAGRQILRHDPDAADMIAELGSRLLRQRLHFLHQCGALGIELRARFDWLKTVRRHCALLCLYGSRDTQCKKSTGYGPKRFCRKF